MKNRKFQKNQKNQKNQKIRTKQKFQKNQISFVRDKGLAAERLFCFTLLALKEQNNLQSDLMTMDLWMGHFYSWLCKFKKINILLNV